MKVSLYLYILAYCAVFSNQLLYAQESPRIVPPAPNAAALAQYADIPVSKYTGVPNISIPLHTINSGEIQLPISLSYHSSGIKANQEASSVGLGWSLNAGGIITRQIRGIDDFNTENQYKGYLISPELPVYGSYNGLYGTGSTGTGSTILDPFIEVYCQPGRLSIDGMTYIPGTSSCSVEQVADTESDLYSFNFGKFSGKFVVNKDGSTVLYTPDSGIIIKVINTNNWQATTNDGIIYKFAEKEYTTPYSYNTSSYSESLPFVKGGNASSKYISSWFLSEIRLPNGETINFYYNNLNTDAWSYGPISIIRAQQVPGHINCSYDNERLNSYNLQYTKSSSQNNNECYLNSIVWLGGSINFSYSDRDDIDASVSQKSKKIETISIKKLDGTLPFNSNGTEISRIKFNYTYFNSQDYNNTYKYLSLRLKLDSLSIDDKVYGFNYINPNSLSKKNSNSIDHWGYFNNQANLSEITQGSYGNTYKVPYFIPELLVVGEGLLQGTKFYEGANRKCNPTVLTNGMLSSIQYPTKGLVSFEFEPNTFLLNLNDPNTSYGLLEYDDVYDDQLITAVDYAYDAHNCGISQCYPNNNHKSKTFVLTGTTVVAVKFQYYPYGSQPSSYVVPTDTNGNGKSFGSITRIDGGGTFSKSYYFIKNDITETYEEFITLAAGTYVLSVFSNAQNFGSTAMVDYSVEKDLANEKVVVGGGVRVKKITSQKNTRVFDYNQDENEQKTSGILLVEPNYGYINYNMFECFISFLRESSPASALSESVATVGYSCVKESISDQIDTSHTISKYKNNKEFRSRGSNIPVLPEFGNGILLEERFLKNSITLYKKNYNYIDALVKPYEYYNTYFLRLSFAFGNYYAVNYYKIKPAWWKLISETTQSYYYNEVGVLNINESKIDFEYNPDNYLIKQTTSEDSDGHITETKIYYPDDVLNVNSLPGEILTDPDYNAINVLKSQNRKNIPIQTDNKDNGQLLSTRTIYRDWKASANSVVRIVEPQFIKTLKGVYHATTNPYQTRTTFYDYDTYGNPLEVGQSSGQHTSYLWGYGNQLPVAKVDNASYSELTGTGIVLSTINSAATDDQTMRNELNKLRTLSNSFVTTYTYKPLIGLTSETDPKGYTIYYEYDDFNRLEYIRDAEGKILSKHEYHYKGQ
jgi:YD repeat-containing protein